MKSAIILVLMLLASGALGQEGSRSKARISIPGVTGVLELDVGPTPWQVRVRPDGKEVQLRAMQRRDDLLVTAFLQKVDFPASPEKCRSEWWPGTEKADKEHHIKLEHLTQTTKDGIARVEYIIPEFHGARVRQKGLHAYLGSRDLCAEIHLSKVSFSPEDQRLFEELLATVKLLPDEPGTQGPIGSAGQPHGRDQSRHPFSGSIE